MSVATHNMASAVQRWARGVLTSDADIVALLPDNADGIFGGDPRQGATRPYGVVQIQAVPDPVRPAVGRYRLWTDVRMLVKWVGAPEDYETLIELANRADAHFEAAQFQMVGDDVMIVVSTRAGEFAPPADELAGVLTEQLGTFYQVKAQELGQP